MNEGLNPSVAEVVPIRLEKALSHVALRGEFDIERTQRVELAFTAATAARHVPTIVDMSAVTYLASYALGMLIAAARAVRSRGHRFVVLSPSPRVAEVLAAARLESLLPIAATEAEALAMINGA
ncbi:MAG: STAS domain-containing protein [Phycisphaerales bacterium]